ncbi:hypothetical protein PPROV_000665500 [Pycnococcus provasolii]|uniref:Uncharacterized protein n=1 Tax=Pycnococcus provasolii TaxID=41880 RepID=A0A830HMJ6_9CHLO|nr:hypothetical protein PPROV_000665500 [Pycnococcus provasolii]
MAESSDAPDAGDAAMACMETQEEFLQFVDSQTRISRKLSRAFFSPPGAAAPSTSALEESSGSRSLSSRYHRSHHIATRPSYNTYASSGDSSSAASSTSTSHAAQEEAGCRPRSALLRTLLPTALVSGALTLGPLAEAARAAQNSAEMFVADPDLQLDSDFYVNFDGFEVDHKTIVYLVVLGQFIGFVGALVSGISAKNRKEEIERLAAKLQEVNRQLRQQSRSKRTGQYSMEDEKALRSVDASSDELAEQLLVSLRTGKNLLKDEDKGEAALAAFDEALALTISPAAKSALESQPKAERKARRGRGAALAQLHRCADALVELKQVLAISERLHDSIGVGDAYGVIADLYTELGDLEEAGKYYDLYIATLDDEDVNMDDESFSDEIISAFDLNGIEVK